MRHMFGVLVLVCASAPLASAQTPNRGKPNVVILLTDDQGLGDFSCMGNPILKTPNFDRFHSQSIRFVDFHAAPMCTPTRGQLLTARDAVRNGATSVTGGRAFMRPGLQTLSQLLRLLGYRTGLFGKWHLGDNYPHRPNDRGFDEAVYHLGWGMTAAPEFQGKMFDGRYLRNGKEANFKGYMTDFWFDEAMTWMGERNAKNEPFFCYLPTNAPHAPHIVAEKYSAPYKGKAAGFFGMIANLDENLARLDDFLKKSGLYENTIVIVMTDNGGTTGVPIFNAGLRGGKTTFYEGGHRVPCWIRWPAGNLGEPRDIDTPAQVQDVMPTLLELVGGQAPKDYPIDGRSLGSLLRGEKIAFPDRMMVVQYSRAELKKYECCVIWNQWRLVHGKELYDTRADRAQKNDLAEKHPDVAKKMLNHYEGWWKDLEPLSNTFVATTLGSKQQPSVALTSSDWQDIYSDNAGHVSQAVGGPKGAWWNVNVEVAGTYEIHLRRWPAELNLPLTSAPARKDAKELSIAAGKLTLLGKEGSATAIGKDAREIVIRIELPKGEGRLQAWFQDAQGQDLCGAFYATVVKK